MHTLRAAQRQDSGSDTEDDATRGAQLVVNKLLNRGASTDTEGKEKRRACPSTSAEPAPKTVRKSPRHNVPQGGTDTDAPSVISVRLTLEQPLGNKQKRGKDSKRAPRRKTCNLPPAVLLQHIIPPHIPAPQTPTRIPNKKIT